MKKVLITLIPFLFGMMLAFAFDFPKDGFYMKDMSKSTYSIYISNLIICLIILYSNKVIADIVYVCNLFLMGMVVYIMIFIMNSEIYYHVPVGIFTFIYTYVYARNKQKKQQVLIIAFMIFVAAVVEEGLRFL